MGWKDRAEMKEESVGMLICCLKECQLKLSSTLNMVTALDTAHSRKKDSP